ncbi:hypothetical protein RchiOBHm_Chr6g0279991 [Rosa chinensis]|uniref:Transcription factor TFIIIC triple barrel domain-containing protein n=1 Tax=Rosa chinensis TaxID=74649 RepID=A0A2P6PT45_ROSCH|nr:uncharacterized protein LOC112170152 isoform X1 [Rosa chinensis]XP_024163094.1 uncharacterized protein LOC112170152 isoform X1 [Rosa chinensis]XP_024163095.1 uncharacterized protein LOC112170152 isoform X1 [Rosa chinensis]PRQ25108.1 hypothetical protein RchiOBHm_Chr6g0279991 [Rosa chinensis]
MEGDTVRSEHQEEEEEEEYVLLDLDSVYSQLQIPPNAPYVLSGLDTMQPVLILDGKFKLIGQWDETIGTCLLFKEEVVPVVHEETGPSEANLFAGKCIVDQKQSSSKQVKPVGRTHRILKFRLAPNFDSPNTASAQTEQVNL